ncbi:MAG: D-aminoacyl-tRNA deacylase [bacterium]
MRLLIQRVTRATVSVESELIGQIGAGFLIFVGIGAEDTEQDAQKMASKACKLRIFDDSDGKMNLDILQTGGSALIVSQFTLYADTAKGNRPNYTQAANPSLAKSLYERFIDECITILGTERVAQGRFGAMMDVELINDGPVTIWLDKC